MSKSHIACVELLVLDRPGNNGRIYTTAAVKAMLKKGGPVEERMRAGQLLGEAVTPVRDPELSTQDFIRRVGQVVLEEVCLKVHHLRIEGDRLLGVVEPHGPKAALVREIFDRGEVPSLAMRSFTNAGGADDPITNIVALIGFDLIPPVAA